MRRAVDGVWNQASSSFARSKVLSHGDERRNSKVRDHLHQFVKDALNGSARKGSLPSTERY